ncbi:MAG: LptA/OstA family protein [Myxococcota bacterium]|nr:LptA/OstA family protein [Myxococcota bacterium]
MIALILAALIGQTPGKPPPTAPRPTAQQLRSGSQQIDIKADRLEIQGRANQAVWVGRVRAKRGNTDLSCDRLVAYYTPDQQISKIECTGSVEMHDGDRWAKGERAEFDNARGVLIVTGSPEAQQGPNHMRGTKVTFHMEKDLVQVENPVVVIKPGSLPGGAKKAP